MEMVEENEKKVEAEAMKILPIPEENMITRNDEPISTLNIKLDAQLFFSNNFIQCTKRNQDLVSEQ